MVQQLLPGLGFAWTMRCVGFVQLALLIVANAFLKPRMPPRKAGPWVEWAAFKEAEYTLFAVGMFFVCILLWQFHPKQVPLDILEFMLTSRILLKTFWGVYFAFYYVRSLISDTYVLFFYSRSLDSILC